MYQSTLSGVMTDVVSSATEFAHFCKLVTLLHLQMINKEQVFSIANEKLFDGIIMLGINNTDDAIGSK